MSDEENRDQAYVLGLLGGVAAVLVVIVLIILLIVGGLLWIVIPSSTPRATQTELVDSAESPTPLATITLPATITPTLPLVIAKQSPVDNSINRLVVVSQGGQLSTVYPDGKGERSLTNSAENRYAFPAWSPDGSMVAALRRGAMAGIDLLPDTFPATNISLYDSDQNNPIYLSWSPDSQWVSFIDEKESSLGFYLATHDGSEQREVATGAPLYWDWSANSTQIFVHSGLPSVNQTLFLLDPVTGETTDYPAEIGNFQSPDISADNRYLAYATQARELVIEGYGEAITETRRTATHRGGNIAFAWSPTENKLAYISSARRRNTTTFGPLSLLDSEGNMGYLTRETVLAFFWAPNGRSIAYLTVGLDDAISDDEVFRPKQRTNKLVPIQNNEPLNFNLWAVDVATGQKRQLANIQPSNLFIQQFLPFFDQYARSHTLWSPASDAIALPILDNGVPTIYRFPIDGSLPTPIIPGTIAFWSPQ